eukprot:TRINITY_DN54040_c0_g1_i1.p1 TRINITY_DN54040_c0_g1~~TRINITY_DN54040_c0_g1_i1.p1  ORF type:complete len:111 (-),score=12.93 TRINITY_DN54040_c0_g1_i1:15-347(-)
MGSTIGIGLLMTYTSITSTKRTPPQQHQLHEHPVPSPHRGVDAPDGCWDLWRRLHVDAGNRKNQRRTNPNAAPAAKCQQPQPIPFLVLLGAAQERVACKLLFWFNSISDV